MFASFIAASLTLFILFFTFNPLNLLEEDLPPTGLLSSNDAVNALQSENLLPYNQLLS